MSAQENDRLQELVEYMVRSIVDNPDSVKVEAHGGGYETVLELSVANDDMGRVIGKGGRVINSIRSIVQVLATKQGQRVNLELLED